MQFFIPYVYHGDNKTNEKSHAILYHSGLYECIFLFIFFFIVDDDDVYTDMADGIHVQYGVTHKENYYVHITKAGKEHVPFLLYIILNVFTSSATIHVRTVCNT